MRIVCIGGGPAGLYFGLLMKGRHPAHEVTVIERNRPYDTFGWGVVFSDATMDNMRQWDAITAGEIEQAFNHWDAIELLFKGRRIRCEGHGFVGIGRKRLLNILQTRCEALGVRLIFDTESLSDADFPDADLIVGSDGINSTLRRLHAAHFRPDIVTRPNRYIWLGTPRLFDAFTFDFRKTAHGWFQAHIYRFDEQTSTFIVECPESVWLAHGLDRVDQETSIAFCAALFAETLQGAPLLSNARHLRGSAWLNFQRVLCENWWLRTNQGSHLVLMGDAVHTAHFAIGSGTKLALEDAIELTRQFDRHGHRPEVIGAVLADYEAVRRIETLRIQNAAWNAMEWFEVCGHRYCDQLAPEQFMYAMLTRSQRISHENLRLRDRQWLEAYERWFARAAHQAVAADRPSHDPGAAGTSPSDDQGSTGASPSDAQSSTGAIPSDDPSSTGASPSRHQSAADTMSSDDQSEPWVPPMFTPYRIRSVRLKNRVVVSPMAQYAAIDGVVGGFHLVHIGARALGGAALVMLEMTAPCPDGRITPHCPGLWNEAQQQAFAHIVAWVHAHSDARIGLQLGHAGPKGSTNAPWDDAGADRPLPDQNWPLHAASALPYLRDGQVPTALHRAGMCAITDSFVQAAGRAAAAGFDWLELHCAHGYLLSAFISPLTNRRTDAYGGSLDNRLRFPREVCAALRAAWPEHLPLSVRISAHDWVEGGTTPHDAVEIARAFKASGADLIDCSSGQVSPEQRPVYGRMYQTPFADRIRQEAGIATMAVGAISEADHVNSIIASGRADLCAVGRPHLANPAWTLHEAARIGYQAVRWPRPYLAAKRQLETGFERAGKVS